MLQIFPSDWPDLGIKIPIVGLLPKELKILLRHAHPRQSLQLLFHHQHKIFVVRDHHQLKVSLNAPVGYNLRQGLRQPHLIFVIQVGRRFVQGHHAAVDAERLGQGQADDDASQNPLAGAAASSHVDFGVSLRHDHPIVVGSRGPSSRFLARHQFDTVDIFSSICQCPKFLDNFINIFNFHTMILKKRLIHTFIKFIQIRDTYQRSLAFDHFDTMPFINIMIFLRIEPPLKIPLLLLQSTDTSFRSYHLIAVLLSLLGYLFVHLLETVQIPQLLHPSVQLP
mmetsp:Transcript_33713/g.77803  ORF Transcript_33713/g.77803 Transcript_33713/m.77803 type:complete len:281 (+) Transcript_33713:80-922(+)